MRSRGCFGGILTVDMTWSGRNFSGFDVLLYRVTIIVIFVVLG